MAIFACSFDAGTPLGGWTSSSAVSIGSGRTSSGGGGGISAVLSKTITAVASLSVGGAYIISDTFQQFPTLTFSGGPTITATHLGDGRFTISTSSTLGSSSFNTTTHIIETFLNWHYHELYANVSTYSVIDNGNGTSTVTMIIDIEYWIDNELAGSGQYNKVTTVANGSVPTGTFTAFSYTSFRGATLDDIYANGSRLGDSEVSSDDTTVTQVAGNLHLTQQVLEWANTPGTELRLTQHLIENTQYEDNNKMFLTQHCIEVAIGILGNKAYVDEA